ncbi:Uncharacterised protein [Mycolicibacterium phlei]|nr:Uncharacterised protein [Mycolicibacterium phlei]
MIGNVTESQYQKLVAEGHTFVEQHAHAQFGPGDFALKVAPCKDAATNMPLNR